MGRDHICLLYTSAPDSLPDEVYAGLDYLTPNESEFKHLTGCPTDEVEELAVHCKPLLEKGTRNIICLLYTSRCV